MPQRNERGGHGRGGEEIQEKGTAHAHKCQRSLWPSFASLDVAAMMAGPPNPLTLMLLPYHFNLAQTRTHALAHRD